MTQDILNFQGEDAGLALTEGFSAKCSHGAFSIIRTSKRKRLSRISGGGLRQFSMKVCEKVESKGSTTYSEVADEIIAEFTPSKNNSASLDKFDEKNIRRRVYDALNVLMAMNIITRDRKEIQWKGFPQSNVPTIKELEILRIKLMDRIKEKTTYLQELEEQIEHLENLILRNQQLQTTFRGNLPEGISLPFILVQTSSNATVEIEISEDMRLVHFDFNSMPFTVHDSGHILKGIKSTLDLDSGR